MCSHFGGSKNLTALTGMLDRDNRLQADSQPKSSSLVGGRLALFYIHQMNQVNSRNNLVVMMPVL